MSRPVWLPRVTARHRPVYLAQMPAAGGKTAHDTECHRNFGPDQDLRRGRALRGENMRCNGIDLNIPRGTVFGLLGPNGAGKSTTDQHPRRACHQDHRDGKNLGLRPRRKPAPVARGHRDHAARAAPRPILHTRRVAGRAGRVSTACQNRSARPPKFSN